MEATISDWLHLVLRWFHIIAAIAWIGHAFFFNMLDSSLEEPLEGKSDDVEGELWMVHGGGFYRLQKTFYLPEKMPGQLHWFYWEAAFTWLSGFFLLAVVYYMGGGILLVDPTVSDISVPAAIALSIGLLVVSFVVYDQLWASPLGKMGVPPVIISVVLLLALIYGTTQVFSGRAAFIHVGAVLGTLMAGNVWVRIIPAMRQMVAALKEGKPFAAEPGKNAKQRSRHNNYMIYPVIFIMLSNHFPSTYGHELNWLILVLLFVAGAGIKHVMNVRFEKTGQQWVPFIMLTILMAIGGFLYLTTPQSAPAEPQQSAPAAAPKAATNTPTKQAIDASTVGSIAGVVEFKGEVPEAKEVTLTGGCQQQGGGKTMLQSVQVKDGKLADVFVAVIKGHEQWQWPAAPSESVILDQQGCIYKPHVIGLRVGQPLEILNSDPLLHNVRTVAKTNRGANLAMPPKMAPIRRTYDKPERMIHAKCDVHPWMSAFIGVMEHPYFSVSKEDGSFSIDNLPPGTYTLEAWHETYGSKTQEIVISPSQEAQMALSFGG